MAFGLGESTRELPSFDGATVWLNSEPLTPGGLRGQVVLVEFCTYSCVNWLRTLPYVRAWDERYRDDGLVVIGAHTPSSSSSTTSRRSAQPSRRWASEYPIAVDNDYGVWRAFDNNYWPALYFADAEGRLRHHHYGEEDYDGSERVIQQLLTEAGVTGTRWRTGCRWMPAGSSARRLGHPGLAGDVRGLRPGGGLCVSWRPGARPQSRLRGSLLTLDLNNWSLSGDWTAGAQPDGAESSRAVGSGTASMRGT